MGQREGATYTSFNVSLLTLVVVVVIGISSLLFLWMGFQAYGSNHPERANYYIIVGTAGFAVMGYMFFRTRVTTPDKLEVPKINVITTLECNQCGLKRIREFRRGDYVYKDNEPCTRCEGQMLTTRIHRREEEQKRR